MAWEESYVVVCFVDIDLIVDYPCLNFLFIITEEYMDVNERGKSFQNFFYRSLIAFL